MLINNQYIRREVHSNSYAGYTGLHSKGIYQTGFLHMMLFSNLEGYPKPVSFNITPSIEIYKMNPY